MRKKVKQWMTSIALITTKRTITSHHSTIVITNWRPVKTVLYPVIGMQMNMKYWPNDTCKAYVRLFSKIGNNASI